MAGNYFDKYNSKNPLVKFAANNFLNTLFYFLDKINPKTILDIGCGQGEIEKRIKQRYKNIYIKGIDLEDARVFKNFDFEIGNALNYQNNNQYDAIIMLEVLEHIINYKKALQNIKKLNAKNIIISVPWEPWFRLSNLLRLKYNTPGHVHHFSANQFKKLIDQAKFKKCLIWQFAWIKN